MSRIAVHFDRASIVPTPRKLIHTRRHAAIVLRPQFLGEHDFDCGSHAVVRAADFGMKPGPLGCAVVTQKTLEGKVVRDLYVSSRASEWIRDAIKMMNSMDSRRALEAFEKAYQMNIHFSGVESWRGDKHPWARNNKA